MSSTLSIDGNERIGHAATEVSLTLKGREVVAGVDEQEEVVRALAAGKMERADLSRWLQRVM